MKDLQAYQTCHAGNCLSPQKSVINYNVNFWQTKSVYNSLDLKPLIKIIVNATVKFMILLYYCTCKEH